ncbi:electron transfer flavoprotein beta subunit [Desulfocucumis palustris]|uniref:Electron transfer flavoprotein small subunit n=1 Tax=Desulfocucumis palustris TaxID=1898651 RepID=A0A2L2XFH9_9FIRM|nr:electron transfer flavoprotein subunit beta/FixA family protein [Desulfocucumis palustris]GBF34920.1 electron transfer flavoprotein beta subunit [Desulfocucumis palustris]
MLNIIACFKWVVDEADVKIDAKSRALLMERVGYKISDYDRNAIEEAVRLQEQHGGNVVAATVGPSTAKQCLKDALSRGPERADFINDPSFVDLEPEQTAAILATAIKAKEEYDLIICGEGSSDLYAQQVGPALAERLGIPCATCVNKLTLAESKKEIIAERKLDDGMEVVSMPLPALVTVLPDINTPRIPTLKQVLGAAKKPVDNITLNDLGQTYKPCLQTTGILAATMERRRLKFGADEKNILVIIGALLKEGVIA